jgi:P-type Cu+ transporter
MNYIGNPVVSGVLGAAALLGPGRALLSDGFMSLVKGNPNMNSLLFLGTSTSFTAGTMSALLPGLTVDPSFLEEPVSDSAILLAFLATHCEHHPELQVMLLATVLLGRSLEARARAQASGLHGLSS